MSDFHKSVLLKEAIAGLRIKENKKYIDATLGGGGHTGEILKLGGIVLGLDVDEDALAYVNKNFKFHLSPKGEISSSKLTLARGNFRDIDKIALLNNLENNALKEGISQKNVEIFNP